MEQFPNSLSITLLGSAGGAAKAVLAILNQAIVNEKDPIYEVIKNVTFYLVDIKQKIGRIMTSCFQIWKINCFIRNRSPRCSDI